jgi:hypothetical protein
VRNTDRIMKVISGMLGVRRENGLRMFLCQFLAAIFIGFLVLIVVLSRCILFLL